MEPLLVTSTFVNMAPWDRVLRIGMGLTMLLAGSLDLFPGAWGAVLVVFAWVPLVTGAVGWCPLYTLLGLRTLRPWRRRHPSRW
jgi:hypothetical protein